MSSRGHFESEVTIYIRRQTKCATSNFRFRGQLFQRPCVSRLLSSYGDWVNLPKTLGHHRCVAQASRTLNKSIFKTSDIVNWKNHSQKKDVVSHYSQCGHLRLRESGVDLFNAFEPYDMKELGI